MKEASNSAPRTAFMSLKAKIEAVIYAAEEPVSLAQLAAVFGAEIPFPEVSTAADSAEVTLLDESGSLAYLGSPIAAADAGAPRLEAETADVAAPVSPAIEQAAPENSPVEMEAAAKRASRLRDKQVREQIAVIVEQLITEYAVNDRGIEIREIAGGYRMATKPEYHDAVRSFVKNLKPAMKLSQQALETLAVIAYKQPVTSPEIGEIRGVDSGGVLANLISRKLVTTAGRKQVIGRPILYKTTKEFLLGFGLKDLSELPSMEEFEQMAGELAKSDALEAEAISERAGVPPGADSSESAADTSLHEQQQTNIEEQVLQEQEQP